MDYSRNVGVQFIELAGKLPKRKEIRDGTRPETGTGSRAGLIKKLWKKRDFETLKVEVKRKVGADALIGPFRERALHFRWPKQ